MTTTNRWHFCIKPSVSSLTTGLTSRTDSAMYCNMRLVYLCVIVELCDDRRILYTSMLWPNVWPVLKLWAFSQYDFLQVQRFFLNQSVRVTHIYGITLGITGLENRLSQSNYLSQCWLILNWTQRIECVWKSRLQNVGHWAINVQLMTRRLSNASSIPEIKGRLSGRRKPQKKNRINSNTNNL